MIEFTISVKLIEIVLIAIMLISLLLTAELDKLYQVAIAFVVFMTSLSAFFWLNGAIILALFQLTIYAGTTGVILFAVLGVFPQDNESKQSMEE